MQLLVNIDVDDLARAILFYTEVFELHVGRRFGPHAVELLGSQAPMYLLAKAAGTAPHDGAAQPRTYARHWTPVHIDVAVDDLEAALARALAAGAVCEQAIAAHAWGRIAMLADPFGHGFCLLQFSPEGYDAIATD
jgi:predicted enzyme related to lactoylglutathione lyase